MQSPSDDSFEAPEVPLPDDLFIRTGDRSVRRSSPRRGSIIAPAILGAAIAVALSWPLAGSGSSRALLVERVLGLVEDRYVHPVDGDRLLHDGLDSMLRELDPNSRYISPSQVEAFEGDTEGYFVGIGIVIAPAREDVPPTIRAVLRGSPAERADLVHGDQLLEVAGSSVARADLDEVSKLIQGPPGSQVHLRVRRVDGENEEFERWVRRERVTVPSVHSVRLFSDADGASEAAHPGRTGYVRLDQFQVGTASELRHAIENLIRAGATRLILDLRDNRGGYLDQAVEVCDLFLPEGSEILSTKGRSNADRPDLYRATADTLCPTLPLVVLIDGGSASASEIVAAALQDHRRAALIGSESYGKWSVQDVIHLPPGNGIVKLTTKSHHPPEGRWIRRDASGRRLGLVPNLEVEVDRQTRGQLLRSWRDELFEHIETPYQVIAGAPPTYDDTPPDAGATTSPVDAVLIRALGVLSNEDAHAKLLALDPDPIRLGPASATARTDEAQPRESSHHAEDAAPDEPTPASTTGSNASIPGPDDDPDSGTPR
ncbi:MAG: S41 family peptidase [Planctomycetes bacterium]|nr:S41 family peptidase [Planctomycetota bacterium]